MFTNAVQFNSREETDVEEFLISGDHDHYISSETIVLPDEAVAYEEAICEPRAKKRMFFFSRIFSVLFIKIMILKNDLLFNFSLHFFDLHFFSIEIKNPILIKF